MRIPLVTRQKGDRLDPGVYFGFNYPTRFLSRRFADGGRSLDPRDPEWTSEGEEELTQQGRVGPALPPTIRAGFPTSLSIPVDLD